MTADEFAAKLTGSDQCTISRTGEWAYEVTLAGRRHLVELSEQDRQQSDSQLVSAFCYRLAQAIGAEPAR